jgi:hypothetical protein
MVVGGIGANNRRKGEAKALFIWLIIRFFGLFFQSEYYFSLTTNQPTVFFSQLIIPVERPLSAPSCGSNGATKDGAALDLCPRLEAVWTPTSGAVPRPL